METVPHIKLSELVQQISDHVNQAFGSQRFWVIAELSGVKPYKNDNRFYFDFVEKVEGSNTQTAKMPVKAWREGSASILQFEQETGQPFTTGIEVLAEVQVEFHTIYGLSLILKQVDPSFTLGNLEKRRRETLAKLVAENADKIKLIGDEYITYNQELELSPVIQKIALVTSPQSEGYKDFIHTLRNNQFNYTFLVDEYHSSVQGAFAEKELYDSFMGIYNSKQPYDAVILVRGGGAGTDFLVFDTYKLTQIVARFQIPVITGLGHLKDVSIVDLMAHTNTKTPTQAAEFIIAHNRRFEDTITGFQNAIIIQTQQLMADSNLQINQIKSGIVNKTRDYLEDHKDLLTLLNQSILNNTKNILFEKRSELVGLINQLSTKPTVMVNGKLSDLKNIESNLSLASRKLLKNQNSYLNHYQSVVKLMSPKSMMKRGFAIVSKNGKVLKDGKTIELGDELSILMDEETIVTQVKSKTNNNGRETHL